MKREQQLDQVDRLTRPMELRFASAYRRFIGRLRPTLLANVRAGRAPDAACAKDKLPRAFASLYRRDIAAGRIQAERQLPPKRAPRKHLPGQHDQQDHAGGGESEAAGGGGKPPGHDWTWAREQWAHMVAADPEGHARRLAEHEATRLGRDVATMRGGEINRELDKVDRESSKLNDRLIAEGRGNEKPSERRGKLDILSIEHRNNEDRAAQLRAEVAARYGPNAPSRLPHRVGSKPRKEFKARRPMSDLEEGASREVGVAGTRRLPYATGVTFDVGDLIDASLERLGGTLDTLDDRLELVLADAPEDATDEELADLVQEELDSFEDNGKIEDISETEVFGSVNGGRAQAFAENDVEWGQWGTMQDNRVRDTHVDLGESGVHPIGFNYAKLVGFPETLLRWPHDVECEEASLVCNCRCALLFAEAPDNAEEIYDDEMGDLGDEGKSFKDFDPNQQRDDSGKWSATGGGGGGANEATGGYTQAATREEAAARSNTQVRMPEADYAQANEQHSDAMEEITRERIALTEQKKPLDDDLNAKKDAFLVAEKEQRAATLALVDARDDPGNQVAIDAAGTRLTAATAERVAAEAGFIASREAAKEMDAAVAVAMDKAEAAQNTLNASMGADYWATHYEKNPGEFQTTMDELRGSWRHIGGMADKVDPIAFRFASQTAFGLDQGVAFDKKEDRLIARSEYADREGTMTQWAGAMRNEYEDTQEELKSDVEWNAGGGDDGGDYDEWSQSDAYTLASDYAQADAWSSMSESEKGEYVKDQDWQEWSVDNLEKIAADSGETAPSMESVIAEREGGFESSDAALDALRDAGIDVDYDPAQGVLGTDEGSFKEPPDEATQKETAALLVMNEEANAKENAAGALRKQAEDLKNSVRAAAMGGTTQIGALNRQAKELEDEAGSLASSISERAAGLMEKLDKFPGGRTRDQIDEAYNEELDTFIGDNGKAAYVNTDGEDDAKEKWNNSGDWSWDDSEAFGQWSGNNQSSGDPMTITPDDWPLEMTRNVNTKVEGYVPNFSESWALNREQSGFGSNVIREKIDQKKVLVFQGAKHWRADGMGLTEAEFIVLSDRPWWIKQQERNEERARQQEEAQIEDKSGQEGRRESDHDLLAGERRGHRDPERDDRGGEGGRRRDSSERAYGSRGPRPVDAGARPGEGRGREEVKGDSEGHPFRGNQWDTRPADTKPEAGGSEVSGAYERGAVQAQEPRPEVAWRAKPPSPSEFIKAREKSKHGGFLSPLTAAELKGSELHLSGDGKVGYAISADGDFGNLFNNGGAKGSGQTAMIEAIESGKVKTADCFNGYLPELYANFGLKATGAMKFNDTYAPPGWNFKKDDRPDVLFLAFEGGDPETIRARIGTFGSFKHPKKWTEDYDAAKAESRRRAVAQGSSGKSAGGVRVRLRGVDPQPDRGSGHRVGQEPGRAAPLASGVHRDAVDLAEVKAWLIADPFRKDFDPGQQRDESGRWSGDGGGGGGAAEDHPDEQRARDSATERFASDYENNKEAVLAKYTERTSKAGSFYISADEAKELSADYSKDPEGRSAFSAAVHDTSAEIAREAYARALDAPLAPGHERVVVFTAGGPGSGKTKGISNMPAGEALLGSAHIVVDSTLGGAGAVRGIEKALAKGYAVSLVFTYRDAEEAFLNGVVPRANRYGRIVPVAEALSSHAHAYATMQAVSEKYANDPRMSITIIDNSRGRGNARIVDKLPKAVRYGRRSEERIWRQLDQLRREGKIKPSVYRGLKAAAGRTSAQ